MSNLNEFNLADFKPEGKTIAELSQQQENLLLLFEHWENVLQSVKANNRKWKSLTETKKSLEMMKLIDELWKESMKMSARLNHGSYDDISIIQYRMALFMQKRKQYREAGEDGVGDTFVHVNNINIPAESKVRLLDSSIKEGDNLEKVTENPIPRNKKKGQGKIVQSTIDSFLTKKS